MNNDKDLNETELTRVSNALDALEKHNNQPTTNAWEAIMEESNNRSRRVSRRTQLISAAAAAVVVIAITGAAIAVTSNGKDKTIKTVDKKKNENVSTSTTVPLSPEEQLLQNAVLVNGISLTGSPSSLTMTNGKDGQAIDPSSDLFKNVAYRINRSRIYSPDNTKYASISNLPELNKEWTGSTLTIVDTSTGKTTVVKPEPFKFDTEDVAPEGQTISVSDIIWIDNDQFLMATSINTGNGSTWALGSLSKPVSINDAKEVSSVVAPSGSGGNIATVDAAKFNGHTYILSTETPSVEKDGASSLVPGVVRITVADLDTGQVVWTTDIEVGDADFDGQGNQSLSFGENENTVYGSLTDVKDVRAFIYDHAKNKSYFPNADMALFIR